MRPRATTFLYQTASRAWLSLAAFSLLLPTSRRLGSWLPLHLALAGAVSVAIAGAMQNFVTTLTATSSPASRWVWAQFATMNAGVALIAFGRIASMPGLVAVGGSSFVASALILLGLVLRAKRKALHERHRVLVNMYALAVGCVIAGATLGAVMGSGVIRDGRTYVALLHAHMVINVLGWVGLTIVATLVTLLPSILRVRMPSWHGAATGSLLACGALGIAAGLVLDETVLIALSGLLWLGGTLGVSWMVFEVLRTPRKSPIAVSGLHLLCGVVWFTMGSIGLAIAGRHGVEGFDRFSGEFLVLFVGGWIVQTLLGAWAFLLAMGRPGHPDSRRASLVAIEFAAWVQLLALNVGVGLMAADAAGWAGPAAGWAGLRIALLGAGIALVKAWTFPALGVLGVSDRRGRRVWAQAEPAHQDDR